jgi:hypothetical protein
MIVHDQPHCQRIEFALGAPGALLFVRLFGRDRADIDRRFVRWLRYR